MNVKEKAIFFQKEFLKQKRFDYECVYFGDEFCERLLPDSKMTAEILQWCGEIGVNPVLVTPYMSNAGIRRFDMLIQEICGNFPDCQISINDWGALELLRGAHMRLRIWLGRVLSSRFFVLVRSYERGVRKSQTLPERFVSFLSERDITGVEFNVPIQLSASCAQLKAAGIKSSIYLPYIYVTTSRYCYCAGEYEGYFKKAIISCNRECLVSSGVMRSRGVAKRIFTKGNAHFIKGHRFHPVGGSLDIYRVVDNGYIGRRRTAYKERLDEG